MTVDRSTVAWVRTFKEMLEGFNEALGGENITPARRALARTIATLQTELVVLGDHFAAGGRASADDLAQYLKISATVADLLKAAGIDQMQPARINPDAEAESARQKLQDHLLRLVEVAREDREKEEASGIFRNPDGDVITNPEEQALEQALYNLRHPASAVVGEAQEAVDASVPSPAPPPAPQEPFAPRGVLTPRSVSQTSKRHP
jgi:hypothetical protein